MGYARAGSSPAFGTKKITNNFKILDSPGGPNSVDCAYDCAYFGPLFLCKVSVNNSSRAEPSCLVKLGM